MRISQQNLLLPLAEPLGTFVPLKSPPFIPYLPLDWFRVCCLAADLCKLSSFDVYVDVVDTCDTFLPYGDTKVSPPPVAPPFPISIPIPRYDTMVCICTFKICRGEGNSNNHLKNSNSNPN